MKDKYIYFKQGFDHTLNTEVTIYTARNDNLKYQLFEFRDFTWGITIGTIPPSTYYATDQWELRYKVKQLTGREITWLQI